jgi:hypothetical protein
MSFGTNGIKVRDVVADVVADVAPEELPVVRGLAGFDDRTVVRRLAHQSGRREPLGFGLGEVVVMVTPVVWLAVDQAAKQFGGLAADGTATGAKAMLRKVFRKRAGSVAVPALTHEQLAQVHQLVVEMGVRRGLGEKRSTEIANAVVTRLVLAVTAEGGQQPPGPDRATSTGSTTIQG